jgi:hypothetical protein
MTSGFVSEARNHSVLLDESLFSIGFNGHVEIVTTRVLFSEKFLKEATAGCATVHCARCVN